MKPRALERVDVRGEVLARSVHGGRAAGRRSRGGPLRVQSSAAVTTCAARRARAPRPPAPAAGTRRLVEVLAEASAHDLHRRHRRARHERHAQPDDRAHALGMRDARAARRPSRPSRGRRSAASRSPTASSSPTMSPRELQDVVGPDLGRARAAAVAAHVGREHAVAGAGERGDLVAPRVRRARGSRGTARPPAPPRLRDAQLDAVARDQTLAHASSSIRARSAAGISTGARVARST